jgi:hypothetical protein
MTALSDLRSLAIRATKGNELMEFISEDMQKGMFQATLAAAIESTFTIRVRNTICALGARGDYLEAVLFCSVGTAGQVPNVDTVYLELVDYTGVPASVQHTIFGEVSPFISPSERLESSMLNGIDRQELSITNSEVIADQAACATGKTQYVRGSLDSRITYQADHNDIESITEMSMKFKPNSDGVFLINAGSRIWANPAANALG